MDYSVCLLMLLLIGVASGVLLTKPEQIHISTDSPNAMTIVWNTVNDTTDSTIRYGTVNGTFNLAANGTSFKFVDGGPEKRAQFIHTVTLTGLKAKTVYYYKVGSVKYGFSDILSFKTWPQGEKWSPSLAVYGDLGYANAQSLLRLKADADKGMYDAIIHVGDFAYDMDSDDARVGDEFMRAIQPLASSLPYMTCPGNHEEAYNFSNYKNRFRMPGDIDQRMYFSFKMGPIRFISTATEYIFFPQYGLVPIIVHYEWLEKELKDANLPENRAKQPWVITYGHRPMYCSNENVNDCTHRESLIRMGIPIIDILGWEKLFRENGVDLAFWAHEHSYERMWPVYNRKVMNGSTEAPYTNPKATVHITTGSAGCKEIHDKFKKTRPSWSAFRSDDYGYTRMKVYNSTHLYMEQVSDDKGGAVIDKMLLIKDTHGAFEHDPSPVEPVGDQEELVKMFLQKINYGNTYMNSP